MCAKLNVSSAEHHAVTKSLSFTQRVSQDGFSCFTCCCSFCPFSCAFSCQPVAFSPISIIHREICVINSESDFLLVTLWFFFSLIWHLNTKVFSERSMFVLDLPGWNSLPRMLQHSVSSSSFKTALKIYLLKNFPKLLPLSQSSLYSCHLKSFCVWLVLLPNTLWSHSVWKMGSFSSNYTDPQGEPPCPCASMCKFFFLTISSQLLKQTSSLAAMLSHCEHLLSHKKFGLMFLR